MGPASDSKTRAFPIEPGGGWLSREVEAMSAAWDRGEPISAAEIIEGHPEIDSEGAIRLIYEEVCLRRESGVEIGTAEVVGRYPRWGDELQALFDCDRLLRPSGEPAVFPEVGETVGSFRLLGELGRGASGRTFLATDPTLADRPVVLKIIPDDQEEHLALARLRHTHIVPLFSEHSLPDRGLRLLCMPYLGGASLAQILGDLAGTPEGKCSGQLLVDVIDRNTRTSPAPPPAEGPFRRKLEAATYVEAMVWITSCLADALHYAHARGLVHMDIKPSNVLITVDGQPMLLDFHLARPPIGANDWVTDRLGGTPGWMSPEQQGAMEAVSKGKPVPTPVDGRTDIYALGQLLREALCAPNRRPVSGEGEASTCETLPISVGLEDIIKKTLAWTADDRYEDAATLADDLRRQLNDQPLKGVGNRSLSERWAKWRRRRPGALAWLITWALILGTSAGAIAFAATGHLRRTARLRETLADGTRLQASGRHDESILLLERGLRSARSMTGADDLARDFERKLHLARVGRLAKELHAQADVIRFRFGIALPPRDQAETLAESCRAIWDRRGDLLAEGDGATDTDAGRQVRTDLLEIAVVLADIRLRLAPDAATGEAEAQARRLLEEARQSCGDSLAIDRRLERLDAPRAPSEAIPGPARGPKTPWEHYDLGRYYLRLENYRDAAAEFRRTLDFRPQDLWSNFYQGLCSYNLGQFDEAAAAFRTCIALAPHSAPFYFNRGLANAALGRADGADRDYARALELDPKLVPAMLNRGALALKAGRPREALRDYRQALDSKPDRDTLGQIHYNLALAQMALDDRPAARASAELALSYGFAEARALRDRLR